MKAQPMHPEEVNTLLGWTPSFTERVHAILDGAAQAAWIRRQRSKPPAGAGINKTTIVALWTFVALTMLSLMAACGGDMATVPTPQVVSIGIESGNHQTAHAGDVKLVEAVSVRMAAHAATLDGTVVNGSPVPGAVVCVVNLDPVHGMVPFVPCTNTDSTGHATFFFTPSTTAGTSVAVIRGTYQGQPAVFDTVKATVLPLDPVTVSLRLSQSLDLGLVSVGDTIQLDKEITKAQDKYGNVVTDWSVVWAFSTDSIAGKTVTSFPTLTGSGRKPVVTKGARALYMKIGTAMVWLKLQTR